MKKPLNAETLAFFRRAGAKGGLARNPRKRESSRRNLELARRVRWARKEQK